ncbi:MAG: SURF1 family protein [Methylomonas sp.]|jgi:surfeit locus 1 family protein|uniref:SURF1 family protein n=1 Tax=Methylomonas sp. TaxID=418 RepID=UPI0025F89278|nr:SURF1 family protein [Methylomonas sp.]MCK9606475.1 SURF1 family protein [Methylomonas sp.]
MKFKLLNRSFQMSWLGVSAYALMMLLLCSLGVWQLGRAEQKKQMLLQQQAAIDSGVINLNQQAVADVSAVRYRKAKLTGHYDPAHQFLLDNQIVDGKTGYFVLTPFRVNGRQSAILINRGWLAVGGDRNQMPDLTMRTEPTEVTGRINQFPSVGLVLKGAEIPTENWPSVVQIVDSKVLSQKLGYEIAAFQIELEASVADGYKREWRINVPIPPEKHLAYAVQWFGLALTLTALFIWISIKNRSEHTA